MKLLLAAIAATLTLGTGTASAATYSVDQLLNLDQGGFRSSVIHRQDDDGDMSGSVVAEFDEAVLAGGTWLDNGDIAFEGSIAGVTYAATGNIDMSGGGNIFFDFDNAGILSGLFASDWTFIFDGTLAMGPANSFDGSVISLWGDTQTCAQTETCYGIDLRIAVSEMATAPIPASVLLMLGGLGALTIVRRKTLAA